MDHELLAGRATPVQAVLISAAICGIGIFLIFAGHWQRQERYEDRVAANLPGPWWQHMAGGVVFTAVGLLTLIAGVARLLGWDVP